MDEKSRTGGFDQRFPNIFSAYYSQNTCYLRRRKPQITCYLLFKINATISPTNVKM